MSAHRPLLFSVAYNMLGDRADADDVVQDVLLKWEQSAKTGVANEQAYLVKSTVNAAINELNSARRKRRTYPNIWLPEPLPDDIVRSAGPDGEMRTMLTYELMVLARELSPVELAVFVLREAFNYSHEEIAEILEKRPDHCRQLYKRAKDKIRRPDADSHVHTDSDLRLAGEVVDAIVQGDVKRLMALLTPDVRLMADGGGKVAAAASPTVGAERVAHLLTTAARKAGFVPRIEVTTLNSQPGFIAYHGHQPVAAYVLTAFGSKVGRMYVILNPDKLAVFKKS
ncbi:MAG: DNA-directed RNA polymerase sigma-70 factor [Bacteroidia bacterium]|nr:MAG: DNA-directed RNA polymerase sigma-70 factor [Bacteroidia bacterium]